MGIHAGEGSVFSDAIKVNLSHFIPLWLRPVSWLLKQIDQYDVVVSVSVYSEKWPMLTRYWSTSMMNVFGAVSTSLSWIPPAPHCHRHLQLTTAERLKQLNEKLPLEAKAVNPLTLYFRYFIRESAVYVHNALSLYCFSESTWVCEWYERKVLKVWPVSFIRLVHGIDTFITTS